MTGSLITNNGKKVFLYRTYTENASLSSTQYLAATQFKIGINNRASLAVSDTALTLIVPIGNGTTCDDGSNVLTGSGGADNSTSNTTTYKEGAGNTDATAQNLIGNSSSATKTWINANLATAGTNADSTKYVGCWFYILDAATLAKFKSTGTCLELRLGADSTTNYYSKTYTVADLAVGWNWLCDNALLSTWTVNGTPGTLNDFAIIITTNNATDAFAAGDVIYDLLRQWVAADFVKDTAASYPTINYSTLEVTSRAYLTANEANGFLINGLGFFNEDSTPLMTSEDTVEGESKSSSDEFAFSIVDRIL